LRLCGPRGPRLWPRWRLRHGLVAQIAARSSGETAVVAIFNVLKDDPSRLWIQGLCDPASQIVNIAIHLPNVFFDLALFTSGFGQKLARFIDVILLVGRSWRSPIWPWAWLHASPETLSPLSVRVVLRHEGKRQRQNRQNSWLHTKRSLFRASILRSTHSTRNLKPNRNSTNVHASQHGHCLKVYHIAI
jgi:hypothetical protein